MNERNRQQEQAFFCIDYDITSDEEVQYDFTSLQFPIKSNILASPGLCGEVTSAFQKKQLKQLARWGLKISTVLVNYFKQAKFISKYLHMSRAGVHMLS